MTDTDILERLRVSRDFYAKTANNDDEAHYSHEMLDDAIAEIEQLRVDNEFLDRCRDRQAKEISKLQTELKRLSGQDHASR